MMDCETASTISELSRTSSELPVADQCTKSCLTSPSSSDSASESDGCKFLSDDLVCSESETTRVQVTQSDDRESSSESSDEYEGEDDGDRPHQDIIHPTVLEPLFEGSSISVFDSHLLIYQFQLKHELSSGGVKELLQLIKAHTPHTNGLPKSAYLLKQFFGELFPDLDSSVYSYCGSCHQPPENETSCVVSTGLEEAFCMWSG